MGFVKKEKQKRHQGQRGALQEVIALCEKPLQAFKIASKKPGHHFTIEVHCLMVGQEPFFRYFAQYKDVVLGSRILHPNADHSNVLNEIAHSVTWQKASPLAKITEADGVLKEEHEKIAQKMRDGEKRHYTALTIHEGTPYAKKFPIRMPITVVTDAPKST